MITADRLATLLADYVRQGASPVDVLLVGSYGDARRATNDVDAEVAGDLEGLAGFLRAHQIPADLGEDLSRGHASAADRPPASDRPLREFPKFRTGAPKEDRGRVEAAEPLERTRAHGLDARGWPP